MRSKKHKVLWAVVLLVTVAVMNFLWTPERPTNHAFHDEDVLANIAVAVGPLMAWREDKPIAVLHDEGFAVEVRAALLRAEARRAGAACPNDDALPALRALRRLGLDATGNGAEMPLAIQFARWAVERCATRRTFNIRKKVGASRDLSHANFLPSLHSVPMKVPDGVVTGFTTEDSTELKARWREVYFGLARSADAFHAPIVAPAGGRWKVKDMGHFEYVATEKGPQVA